MYIQIGNKVAPVTLWLGKLLPYRPRWLNQLWSGLFGYFWMPCPICGDYFGGHEWKDEHTFYYAPTRGKGVCPKKSCGDIAKHSHVKWR